MNYPLFWALLGSGIIVLAVMLAHGYYKKIEDFLDTVYGQMVAHEKRIRKLENDE